MDRECRISSLEGNQHWFRRLFDSSPDPAWIIDGNLFVDCNDAAVRTLGYANREEILNVHPAKLSPSTQPDGQDSFAKAEQMMALAMARGLHRFEWLHTRADGSEFVAEVTLAVVELNDKPLIYAVWRDTTERRKAEQAAREAESKYRLLFEQASDGIFLQDEKGFIDCNRHGAQMYGLTRAEVIGRSPADLCPAMQPCGRPSADVAAEKVSAAMRGEAPRFEWQFLRADGVAVDAEISLSPVEVDGVTYLQAIVRDITERKRAEAALHESEMRYRSVVDNVKEVVFQTDSQGLWTFLNCSWKEVTGFAVADSLGTLFLDYVHPDDRQHNQELFEPLIQRKEDCCRHEIRYLHQSGGFRWIEVFARLTLDEAGNIIGTSGTLNDITERRRMEDQVRQLAFYDPLTKLPNRRLLVDRLNLTMAASKRSGCYGALLFLDLDNFKPLNDTYGHAVGDLLLIEASDRLKRCVREVDTLARFGGDEFVVILSELDADKGESASRAKRVAEKIHSALSEPYRLTVMPEGRTDATVEHHCTTSIGVAMFMGHETSQDHILRWADMAMYRAKEIGPNSIRFHDLPA
ncbi:MAG: PAS domain S-box protein [Rhodocyclaceae bacterium]|nr:PAS domain S-box protein [Rhodocyclaceae bacterium]